MSEVLLRVVGSAGCAIFAAWGLVELLARIQAYRNGNGNR
jgi:hypothetical protein